MPCVFIFDSQTGQASNLKQTRRRLSVVSDNKLVEGLAGLATDYDDAIQVGGAVCRVIEDYAGVSKKGYAPYNPRKKNQDVLIMEQHVETGTMLMCVFDGHGEAGDGVSNFFKAQLPPTLFSHPAFADRKGGPEKEIDNMKVALTEATAFLENNLLRGEQYLRFSASTASHHTLCFLCCQTPRSTQNFPVPLL